MTAAVPATPPAGGLVCDNVTLCYHERPAIHHLSCALPMGAFAAIVGPNGAGKSTLLHGMLGWIPLTSGAITLDGVPVSDCLRRIAYLPQRRTQDLDFPVDVETVVAMGRFQCRGPFARLDGDDRAAIDRAVADMGLERLRRRPLAELSGGQQQRAFIARALATGADVLLLDEPLAGLDEPSGHDLLARLRSWSAAPGRPRLAVAVIHDLPAVQEWCSHALVLNRDAVACGPVAEAMSPVNLTRAFPRRIRIGA